MGARNQTSIRKLAAYYWCSLSFRSFDPKGNVDISELPDAFKTAASEQEALLFSYETSKTSSNTRLNPTKAFKQTYKLELGSESLLSDANMAIASAGWRFIYSLGKMMITNLLEDLTLVIFLQMTLTKFHTILDSYGW